VRRRLGARDPEPAILLAATVAERQLVVHCCRHARAAGVRPGQTVSSARALLGARPCHLEAHDPEREAAALEHLARVLGRFSPTVACAPPDGLWLGLDGLQRLFGDEAALLERVAEFLGDHGCSARLAAADTPAAARAVARCGPGERCLVPRGGARAALEPLPLAALELEPRTAEALTELGLTTCGQLLALSRAQVATRFGAALLERLDRALGRAPEELDPLRWSAPAAVERELEGATTDLEVLARCVREGLERLCAELLRRDQGALVVILELFPTDAPPAQVQLPLSHPSRDPAHLMVLLEPRLETVQLGFGVDRLRLWAPRCGLLRPRQNLGFGLAAAEEARLDRALGELLDGYAGRFGPRATCTVEVVEAHLPERAFRPRPLSLGTGLRGAPRGAAATDGSERPSHLCFAPEPTEVRVDEGSGALLALRWRGEERRILRELGPERLCAPWWTVPPPSAGASRPPAQTRDYYRVQDVSGRWLWIFRLGERWFVHGEWA
jgi:protein ImuB